VRERSLGEIADDVDRLQRHVDARMVELAAKVTRLTDRFDNAPFVRADLHSEQISSVRNDISSLRQLTMWLLGLLVSAIIGAIVVLVITAGRGGG
jgi:uncharacterized sporulation protein YeaH/YhbH (DUF444 family)